MTDSTDRDACPTPRWLVSPFFPTVKRPPADTSPANARGGARRASDLVIVRLPARTAARFSRRSLRLVPRGAAADLLSAMFVAGNPSSLVGSPRHDGGKRRHPGASGVAYRSTGCGPVSASSTVAGSHGMSASLSTPVHFPKCARADGRGVSHQPGDDRFSECGGNSGARVGRPTHADAGERSRGPESPLRSRRALPSMSLSVGAANEDILQGRPGIVYIDGTKMPQDGWYQRVRARGRCLEKNKKTKGARLALFLCSCFLFSFVTHPGAYSPDGVVFRLPPSHPPSPSSHAPSSSSRHRIVVSSRRAQCFGCGMWTAQSVVLGRFEVYRCRCCAREFRTRATSMSAGAAGGNRGGEASMSTRCASDSAELTSPSSSCLHESKSDSAATSAMTTRSSSRRRGDVATSRRKEENGRRTAAVTQRRAVRTSIRRREERHRRSRSATAADMGIHHDHAKGQRGGGCGGWEDAAVVADSVNPPAELAPDPEVLTSLVSKLRDFLIVRLPSNGVENSLRRVESDESTPVPLLA